MDLIELLETKQDNKGRWRRWAKFLCLFCLKEVERKLSDGLKQKSCGCVQYELSSKSLQRHIVTKEVREKISKNNKGKSRGKGKIVSIETRQKLSEINKGGKHPRFGKPVTEEQRQKISKRNKGKKRTEAQRQKISKTLKGKYVGELSSAWQGGKSFEIYPQEFKRIKNFILGRDEYKCQYPECIEIHDRLHVHHIDYDKKNNNPENLIILGTSCHTKTNVKNKRDYWTEFYQNIMITKIMEYLL